MATDPATMTFTRDVLPYLYEMIDELPSDNYWAQNVVTLSSTGTDVRTVAGNADVDGSNGTPTTWVTDGVGPGDILTIGSVEYIIESVSSETALVLSRGALQTLTGQTHTVKRSTGNAVFARYCNQTLKEIFSNIPLRTWKWTITGDGTTKSFTPPEHILDFHAALSTTVPLPKRSYAASLRESGIDLLIGDLFSDYGFSMRREGGEQKFMVNPTLESGATRTVQALGYAGDVLPHPRENGSAVSVVVTKDSTTVTGTSTDWKRRRLAGSTILIKDATAGDDLYVIDAVASDTVLTLTEAYRGATDASTGFKIGDVIPLHDSFMELLCYGIVYKLYRQSNNPEWTMYRQMYDREFNIKAAEYSREVMPNFTLGLTP